MPSMGSAVMTSLRTSVKFRIHCSKSTNCVRPYKIAIIISKITMNPIQAVRPTPGAAFPSISTHYITKSRIQADDVQNKVRCTLTNSLMHHHRIINFRFPERKSNHRFQCHNARSSSNASMTEAEGIHSLYLSASSRISGNRHGTSSVVKYIETSLPLRSNPQTAAGGGVPAICSRSGVRLGSPGQCFLVLHNSSWKWRKISSRSLHRWESDAGGSSPLVVVSLEARGFTSNLCKNTYCYPQLRALILHARSLMSGLEAGSSSLRGWTGIYRSRKLAIELSADQSFRR